MSFAQVIRAGRSIAIAALVVGFAAACDDPFSPYWDRGTYDLRYANNDRVPAVVSSGPGTSYTEVRGGSLTLRGDHSYQLVVQVREQIGGNVYEFSKVFAGPYESENRTLYLTYVDSDGYSRVMVANWRDGKIELVVPEVDGRYGVLCRFGP
jgi:hypothetical protein